MAYGEYLKAHYETSASTTKFRKVSSAMRSAKAAARRSGREVKVYKMHPTEGTFTHATINAEGQRTNRARSKKKAKRKMKSAAQKLAAWVRSQANRKRANAKITSIKGFKKASKKRWRDEGFYGSRALGPRTDKEFAAVLSRGVKRLKSKAKPARKNQPKPRRIPKSSAWQKAKAVRFVRTRKGVRVDVRK